MSRRDLPDVRKDFELPSVRFADTEHVRERIELLVGRAEASRLERVREQRESRVRDRYDEWAAAAPSLLTLAGRLTMLDGMSKPIPIDTAALRSSARHAAEFRDYVGGVLDVNTGFEIVATDPVDDHVEVIVSSEVEHDTDENGVPCTTFASHPSAPDVENAVESWFSDMTSKSATAAFDVDEARARLHFDYPSTPSGKMIDRAGNQFSRHMVGALAAYDGNDANRVKEDACALAATGNLTPWEANFLIADLNATVPGNPLARVSRTVMRGYVDERTSTGIHRLGLVRDLDKAADKKDAGYGLYDRGLE